jgi:6-phosphogluconolactonase
MNEGIAGADPQTLLYIGTYTGAKSKGIYYSRFDSATGKLTAPELAAQTANPSFLAVHPNHQFLYAVGELNGSNSKKTGAVSAFRIDHQTGKLTLLNQQPSRGAGPCHLAVDKTGKCLLVANYGSGTIAALPIQPDGQLSAPSSSIQHQGSSINPQRQAGPHAHFITTDPANRFALVCDLGLDKVLVYQLDPAKCSLSPNEPPAAAVNPGSGPRHLAFLPNGRFVYLINEIGSTLVAFSYDQKRGALKELQTLSTLPEDFKLSNGCAEIAVHPSGCFVYGSNRGHDSLAIYSIEPTSGRLTLVEHQLTQGKTPRHFAIDPSGNWMLVENQDSGNIVVFRIDLQTGKLIATGEVVEVGQPVCAVFVAGR